jgi:uridine phosphorylase
VHTKDSLHAREFGWGPKKAEHEQYTRWLNAAGVMASEMECAHLFVLAQLGVQAKAHGPVLAGALVAVIGEHDAPFSESPRAEEAVDDMIELALDTFVELAS